ncbi:MAG TPA: M48 family metallopeptidase [Devosiaceae bacterium]|jgi:predicted Zn-dependent protease|nr:M48 family metallopeptidase [Devosiaceae bacterium]
MCQCHVINRRRLLKLGGAAVLPLLAGCDAPPVAIVSEETVEAMGLRAWQEIAAASPASNDAELQSVLDRVAVPLLQAAGERPEEWEIRVFARPDVNAFALPGRKIGVYEGMFRATENLDQLAAVVGHEIGHLQADHSFERMNAEVAADWGLNLLSLVLQLGGVEYAPEIAAALGLGLEYGLVRPYSRGQELEADRIGLEAMTAAGFAPTEAAALWRRMDTIAGPSLPAFLATHPAPAKRVEAIEAIIAEQGLA